MCGIFGYSGQKNAPEIILEGLKRLEYRGYDSWGIAVLADQIKVNKRVGAIGDLDQIIPLPDSNMGIGHCLPPDTLIQMADGKILPISQLRDGDEVCSLNPKIKRVEKVTIKVIKHKSPRYLYKIRTSFGEILCTENHKMFVYDFEKNGFDFKPAKTLQKGDHFVIPKFIVSKERKINFREIFIKRYFKMNKGISRSIKNIMISRSLTINSVASEVGVTNSYIEHILYNDRNFLEDKLQKILPFFSIQYPSPYITPQDTIHGKFINLPKISSPSLMQIIGYFLGNGTAQPKTIRFKDMDVTTLVAYRKLIKEVFNIDGRVVPQNGTKAWLLEVNSVYLSKWFRENIVSRKMDFLQDLGQLPKDEITSLLRGLFDAEGSINLTSKQISLRLTNKSIVQTAQHFLLRFGIVASFGRQERSQANWKDSYGLFLSNYVSFKLFSQFIGFSGKEKTKKLKLLQNERIIIDTTNANFAYQPILEYRKVQSKVDYLYDLQVDPNQNFFANGFLSHNSRWATHGGVTENNAHPHLSSDKSFALAQNGIAENYQKLKSHLIKKGYKFQTETDTEVIVRLIEEKLSLQPRGLHRSLRQAVRQAFLELEGRNTIIILTKDNELIAARNGSPLVIGINSKEVFYSSDTLSFAPFVDKILIVDNGQMVTFKNQKLELWDIKSGKKLFYKLEKIDFEAGKVDKEGYDHFMIKEISENPYVIRQVVNQVNENPKIYQQFIQNIKKATNVYTIGSGTTGIAASQTAFYLRTFVKIPAISLTGAEAVEYYDLFNKNDLVIAPSQSGETADVLEVLEVLKKKGVKIASYVNMPGSSMTRISDYKFMIQAGPEICVMATKVFTAKLAWGYLISKMVMGEENEGKENLRKLSDEVEKYLNTQSNHENIKKLAKILVKKQHIFLLGKYQNLNIMREGMVKIIEGSYIHAHAIPAGDLKHYAITLMEKGVPVIVAVSEDVAKDDVMNAVSQVKARGATVIGISPTPHASFDYYLQVPDTGETSAIMNIIPLQLLAYYMAVELGHNVDKPRNIAKSVTVK